MATHVSNGCGDRQKHQNLPVSCHCPKKVLPGEPLVQRKTLHKAVRQVVVEANALWLPLGSVMHTPAYSHTCMHRTPSTPTERKRKLQWCIICILTNKLTQKPEKQTSQATREVLPLPRLGNYKLSSLNLSLLSFYIPSSAGIKGV